MNLFPCFLISPPFFLCCAILSPLEFLLLFFLKFSDSIRVLSHVLICPSLTTVVALVKKAWRWTLCSGPSYFLTFFLFFFLWHRHGISYVNLKLFPLLFASFHSFFF